jgi:hypothetical protein
MRTHKNDSRNKNMCSHGTNGCLDGRPAGKCNELGFQSGRCRGLARTSKMACQWQWKGAHRVTTYTLVRVSTETQREPQGDKRKGQRVRQSVLRLQTAAQYSLVSSSVCLVWISHKFTIGPTFYKKATTFLTLD